MASFEDLYTEIAKNIGRYDASGNIDTLGLTVSRRGVNFGILFVALQFDPVELQKEGTLIIPENSTSVDITSIADIRLIHKITNTTNSGKDVNFIQEDRFGKILPASLTCVEYCYRHGNDLHVNPPSAANYLQVEYLRWPTEMVNDEDELEFSKYDPIIMSCGTAYAFAALEEGDSAKIWDTVLANFALPYSLNAKKLVEFKEALGQSGFSI